MLVYTFSKSATKSTAFHYVLEGVTTTIMMLTDVLETK